VTTLSFQLICTFFLEEKLRITPFPTTASLADNVSSGIMSNSDL
jgi:hypothetical protein